MSNDRSDVSRASLLVEVGTEELPPASLRQLGKSFAELLSSSLSSIGLCEQKVNWFATPRRLAVSIPKVAFQQPDRVNERRGPPRSTAFDTEGNPTQAAVGFAKSCGITVDKLKGLKTGNGGRLVFTSREFGQMASDLIPECISSALAGLPIAKRMRWGQGRSEFVRPVHWLVVIHGKTVVKCQILGVDSGAISHGHRFLCEKPVRIYSSDTYLKRLKEKGFVVADFTERREIIRQQIKDLGCKAGGQTVIEEDLLDTVTGLVEWPNALLGAFDPDFLEIPPEVLIASMRDHQKFFHIVDKAGILLPSFIAVSNIKSNKAGRVREGNERVLRARLSDARFFWVEDCKNALNDWVENLKGVSFHTQLGSLYDKTCRIEKLSTSIAQILGWEHSRVSRSAYLCKADLASQMVGEFPELQGTMGYHYARKNREPREASTAIAEHYLPKHAGDKLPTSQSGKILAVADRIDTLTGIFSAGEEPTGEKDPYALRRAALGVIRILIEKKLPLDLVRLVDLSILTYEESNHDIDQNTRARVLQFIFDRYQGYFGIKGFTKDEINAVLEVGTVPPFDFYRRLQAVSRFRRNKSAQSLSEANKRVRNILRKASQDIPFEIDSTLFEFAAEEILAASLVEVSATLTPLIERGDYTQALNQLSLLHEPVDRFFTDVMVLTENVTLRTNRLAMLNQLSQLLFSVADISKLQPQA